MPQCKVTKKTVGEQNGNFVLTLKSSETVNTDLGTQEINRTYYISLKETKLEEGSEVTIDLDKFNIREFPFKTLNEKGEENVVQLKWLFAKTA